MKDKKMKAPGIFKKPVKKKKWEKKYLRKIYLPEDRKFLESLATEENGMIRINAEKLSKKDRTRLKALGKAIKKNRKGLNFILILIIIMLAGGILFFQFYYKNRLVQQLIETNLEKVFLAQVDAEGVDLQIFNGRFSVDSLAIANSGEPMKNLVEFSSIEADIDTAELLQGRVYIEELGFTGMKRGTDRETSGELQQAEDAAAQEPPAQAVGAVAETGGNAVDGVINQIAALTGGFDPAQLLEQQKANLVSLPLIEDSVSDIEEYSEHWKERADSWAGKINGWEDSVNYVRGINPDSFSSIENARSTITRLQSIYNDADRDYQEIQSDYSDAEQQYNKAVAMTSEIRKAVEADYAYVESLVTMPAADRIHWAASILEDQLALPFLKYISYYERGRVWYDRFKRFADKKEKDKPERRREGRSLPPPADAPPQFTIVRAFAEGEEPDLAYSITLNNIMSEPEKYRAETSLELKLDMPMTGAASALITEDLISLDVPAAPFDLGESLKALDVDSLTGRLALVSEIAWMEGGFSGSIDMTAADIVLQSDDPGALMYRIVSSSLNAVKPLEAAGDLSWSEDDGLKLSIDTDLDASLGDAVRAVAAEGAEEGLNMLKELLGDKLDGPLADFESVKDELETYIDKIENYESELDDYRAMADEKIDEIEKSVEDNLKNQAETIIKENLPGDAGDAIKDLGSRLKF